MRRVLFLVIAAVVLVGQARANESPWSVGYAEADVTPAQGQVQMSGFGRERHASGALAPLLTQAVVLRDADDNTGVLITADILDLDHVMVEAIRRVMDEELTANPRLLVFGEDVGLRGGIHRATLGLFQRHGGQRVFDTSLSEEGIVGRASGMAMAGLRPVPEIQFRKYADPAMEQISDIGWIRWRTTGKFSAPVVIRMPVGMGKTTGDPYHAYSGEAIYTHLLGWRIAYPSNSVDAAGA